MQVYHKMWSHSDNLGLTNYIAEVSGTSKYRFLGFLIVKLKIKLKLRKSFIYMFIICPCSFPNVFELIVTFYE